MILVYKVAYSNYKTLTSPATYYQQLLLVAFTWCEQTINGTLYLQAQAVASQNSTEWNSEYSLCKWSSCASGKAILTEHHHQCRRLFSGRLSSLSR